MRGLLLGGVGLALAEGIAGLWLADATQPAAGPAIAVLGGVRLRRGGPREGGAR